jgi:hypothetical protein
MKILKYSRYGSLFLLYLLFSCESNLETQSCESSRDVLSYSTKEIKIETKNHQYFFSIDFVYESAEELLYYGYNKATSVIEIIDLSSKSHKKSIVIQKEGEHQILNLTDFYVHDTDSIFIHTGFLKKLYLVNSKGEVINKWTIDNDLPDGTSSDKGYFLAAYPNVGVRFLYLPSSRSILFHCEYLFFENPYDKEFYKKPILVEYSLEEKIFKNLQGNCPSEYTEGQQNPYDKKFPFVLTQKGDIYLGFTKSNYIHQYKAKQETQICAKSRYTEDNFTFLPSNAKSQQYQKDYSLKAHYQGLFYDKHKNFIYRLVKHKQVEKNDKGEDNKYFNAAFSIMVLDKQGNVMGETEPFPANQYDFSNIYPTSKGILISKQNTSNDIEDYLEFDFITILF